jgi:hypothetical protein
VSLLEHEPLTVAAGEVEALFEEARVRTRRRRRLRALTVGLTLAAALAEYLAASNSGGSGRIAETAKTPFADVRAFAHHGELAFVSRGRLWVLDGRRGHLTAVSRAWQTASDPQFSPNGRWLAYTVGTSRLWVARADGTAAKPVVSGGYVYGRGDWLPDGRLVANTYLWRVSATGTLVRAGAVPASLAGWAPDGTAYAFTTERLTSSHGAEWARIQRLSISDSLSGTRRTLVTIPLSLNRSGLHGGLFDGVEVLPQHQGVLFRLDPDGSNSLAADGLDLLDAAAGLRPRDLGPTLGIPLALSTPGRFAITSGGNRYAWQTKHVEVCAGAAVLCSPVRTPPGVLSFDPAFSPAGGTLAFVEAPSSNAGNIGQASVHHWYATNSLWVLRDGSSRPVRIAGTAGAAAPVWSADGSSLLYVANDSLWLLPTLSSKPVRVTAPLFEANVWPGYYGEVGWSSQFAWSSRG